MTAPTVSADRLAEIKARAEAATPGPWSAADERELWREEDPSIEPSWCVSHMRPGFEEMSPTEGYVGDVFTTAGCFESTEADARFVAAAREDVPWLVDQVESLERWKFEALGIIDYRGEQQRRAEDERDNALAEVARLTAERDAAIERLERVIDQWRKTGRAVISEMNRADKAEAERDALAAQVAEAVHLAEVWASDLATDAMVHVMDGVVLEAINEQLKRLLDLRAALADSEADTSDTQPTDQEEQ